LSQSEDDDIEPGQDHNGDITMAPMKEKPVPTSHAKPPRGEATTENEERKDAEPGSETRGRIRKIVERHRETFDELAK